jgi:hypothetical protein
LGLCDAEWGKTEDTVVPNLHEKKQSETKMLIKQRIYHRSRLSTVTTLPAYHLPDTSIPMLSFLYSRVQFDSTSFTAVIFE